MVVYNKYSCTIRVFISKINKSKHKLKNLDQNLINLEINKLILIKIFKIENMIVLTDLYSIGSLNYSFNSLL